MAIKSIEKKDEGDMQKIGSVLRCIGLCLLVQGLMLRGGIELRRYMLLAPLAYIGIWWYGSMMI